MTRGDRPMLIFVSDIHLTDELRGSTVSRAEQFERFWVRIQAARGQRPAHLCFVGDLFDLVRSPSWLASPRRPYHEVDDAMRKHVGAIVDRILERESKFFAAIRTRVEQGALQVHYVLGNHDRLLARCPAARRKVWAALTGRDEAVTFHG
jgi:UDP-2,3-diacylglucosamine pyrophosphatase LpxH